MFRIATAPSIVDRLERDFERYARTVVFVRIAMILTVAARHFPRSIPNPVAVRIDSDDKAGSGTVMPRLDPVQSRR